MARDRFSPMRPMEIFADPTYVPPRRRRLPALTEAAAEGASTPTYLSAAEIDANAELARAREAERLRSENSMVNLPGLARDLGDIASMYGIPGAETASEGVAASLPGYIEYDPEALGAGASMGLGDEASGAIEHFRHGVPYREAQAAAEQRQDTARERSPGSAMLGALGIGLATAPLAGSMTMARGATAGGALGATGGYLGSEGQTAGQRALATLRGGAVGAAEGGLAGGLMRGGRQFAEAASPGILRTIGRSVGGSAAEGAGYGIGQGAIESGGQVGSDEQLRDIGRSATVGGAMGGAFGLPSGVVRAVRPRRAALPGYADDLAPTDLDETALVAEAPEDAESAFTALAGSSTPEAADIQRIRAAGALDRGVLDRVARAFNPGNARRGAREAARVARESGISPRGIGLDQRLDRTIARAERVRDESGARLGALHREVAEGGGVFRGDQLAAPLEAEADRLAASPILDDSIRARIAELRSRADDLRFGSQGQTPNRRAFDELLMAEEVPAEPIPDVPDLEREVTGIPIRRAVAPQALPYEAGRDRIREITRQLDLYNRPNPPAYGTSRDLLATEHRALVPERNAAARAVLGERYATEMRPANERFRLASVLAPADRLGNIARRNDGILTEAIARQGGPLQWLSGRAERVYRQYEPAINAHLAELAAEGARPSALGNVAERLRLALPSAPAYLPAATAAALGSSDASDAARRRAETDAIADVGAEWEPTPEMLDEIDRQGLGPIEIDPELLDEIDRQGL